MTNTTSPRPQMGDELRAALKAIAEGYPIEVAGDRYILVENPKFRPDDGSSPKLIIDVWAVTRASTPTENEAGEIADKLDEFVQLFVYIKRQERDLQRSEMSARFSGLIPEETDNYKVISAFIEAGKANLAEAVKHKLENLASRAAKVLRARSASVTDALIQKEWRCYFCDEVFTDADEASEHFGYMEDGVSERTACQLTKDEKGLVGLLRQAWAEIRGYREEDTALVREVYGLGAKHNTEKREANEKGYADGLRDGRAESWPTPTAHGEGELRRALLRARTHIKNASDEFERNYPGQAADIHETFSLIDRTLSHAPASSVAQPDRNAGLRNALNEVVTNGRWTEGEQYGEWAITKEVYETARDELALTPSAPTQTEDRL